MISLDSSDDEAAGDGDAEPGSSVGDQDAGCDMDIMAAAFQKAVGLGPPSKPKDEPASKAGLQVHGAAEQPPLKRPRAEAAATTVKAAQTLGRAPSGSKHPVSEPMHVPVRARGHSLAAAAAARRAAADMQHESSDPAVQVTGQQAASGLPAAQHALHGAEKSGGHTSLPVAAARQHAGLPHTGRGQTCMDLTSDNEEDDEKDMLAAQRYSAAPEPRPSLAVSGVWTCRMCTLHNDARAKICVVCGEQRT